MIRFRDYSILGQEAQSCLLSFLSALMEPIFQWSWILEPPSLWCWSRCGKENSWNQHRWTISIKAKNLHGRKLQNKGSSKIMAKNQRKDKPSCQEELQQGNLLRGHLSLALLRTAWFNNTGLWARDVWKCRDKEGSWKSEIIRHYMLAIWNRDQNSERDKRIRPWHAILFPQVHKFHQIIQEIAINTMSQPTKPRDSKTVLL